jgi:hypothetical protein
MPRIAFAALGAWLGLMVVAAAAHASCNYPDAEQVFSEYGDNAYYELAPDGGLEGGGTGWTFTNGARLENGRETSVNSDAPNQVSASVPFGATAISPPVCVDATTPSFRLMTINSGKKDTKLKVKVIYETPKIETRTTEIRASNIWGPTEALELRVDKYEERVARIAFTPKEKEGAWLIDDLYIDPFARR